MPSAHLPNIIALAKSQHLESTLPYVKQTEPRLTGPQGLPDPFKPPRLLHLGQRGQTIGNMSEVTRG